jgi:hypothetical protein
MIPRTDVRRTVFFLLFTTIFFIVKLHCISQEFSSGTPEVSSSRKLNGSETYPYIENAKKVFPEWLRNYIIWHSEQRRNKMDDPSTKFLTVACHRNFPCGGVSDRLRSIPYFLLLANRTGRVLLIKWQKYDLEEFLLPPVGGLDWRLPEGMDIGSGKPGQAVSCLGEMSNRNPCRIWDNDHEGYKNQKNIVMLAREDLYEQHKQFFVTDTHPHGTFGQIMNIMFMPTPPLVESISDTMKKIGLLPRQYTSAHFRSRYPHPEGLKESMPPKLKEDIINNAIKCAAHTAGDSNLPVYFTSDDLRSVQYVLDRSPFVAQSNPQTKVIAITDFFRSHSDDAKVNYDESDPKELYPVFIDLWIMGHSKCVSYGQGGFGLFGARLADEECSVQHQKGWDMQSCIDS